MIPDIPPALLQSLGRIIVTWSYVEMLSGNYFARLMRADPGAFQADCPGGPHHHCHHLAAGKLRRRRHGLTPRVPLGLAVVRKSWLVSPLQPLRGAFMASFVSTVEGDIVDVGEAAWSSI